MVFLLMDTRESRWLPTVMGKAAGKIVINAALGFDTYVVMRHGLQPRGGGSKGESWEGKVVVQPEWEGHPLEAATRDPVETEKASTPQSPRLDKKTPAPAQGAGKQEEEEELGCYFCSDVVAPADSLKSATLDQQCTVTRPGAAPLAAALAVELAVSILQHRLGPSAPPPPPHPQTANLNTILPAPPTDPLAHPDTAHPLGTVPHILRGFMSTWQTLQMSSTAYDCCAACSPAIVQGYRQGGWEFVRRAVGEKGYVEEVSGLARVQREAEEALRGMEEMEEEEDDDWGGDGGEEGEGEMV